MQGYPGLGPFFDQQAKLMGLDEIPGQPGITMARQSRAVQLIENHIGQAIGTHEPSARPEILTNCEDHLASIELQFRAACLMLVEAYRLADEPLPAWLTRYQPMFDMLLDSDPGAAPKGDPKKANAPRRRANRERPPVNPPADTPPDAPPEGETP